MVKDIYIVDPDGDLEFDGYDEQEEDTEWELYCNSWYW